MQGIDLGEIYAHFGPGWGIVVVFLITLPAIIVPILNRERKKPADPMAEMQESLISMAKRIDDHIVKQGADHDEVVRQCRALADRLTWLEARYEAGREAYRKQFEKTFPGR